MARQLLNPAAVAGLFRRQFELCEVKKGETVILLTDNNTRSIGEQAITTGILSLCLVIFFGLYALARPIFRLLGTPGIQIVSRSFGLILASIAVHGLIVALKLSFGLAP